MLIMLGQAVLKSIHDIFCTFLVYNYHLRKYFECIVDTKMYFTFIFSLSLAFILKWYQSIKATIHFDISICNQVDSPNVFLLIYYLTWQRKLTDSPGFRVWFNIVFCIWGGPQVSTEILKDDNKLDYCLRCISRNVPEGWFSGTIHILLTGELEN